MLFIINTTGYNEFGKFYPNYYFDENTNIYYDEYLNPISEDRYPMFNIKIQKGGQKGGTIKHGLSEADKATFEDYSGEAGMQKLFTMTQATRWTLVSSMLRHIAIPALGVNPITNSTFDIKQIPRKPHIDNCKDFLEQILRRGYIINYQDPELEKKGYPAALYSFQRMDPGILKFILLQIVDTGKNTIKKVQIAEKNIANCINFFCIDEAQFDDAPKQRQECVKCNKKRTDPELAPVDGLQFDFNKETINGVEITYITAIPRTVIVCYTSMCYNNFNPTYWKMKDGSVFDKKVNGKDIFENKNKDKNGNDNEEIYKFLYKKPVFKWQQITGNIPVTKKINDVNEDGTIKKKDGKEVMITVNDRDDNGVLKFMSAKNKDGNNPPFKRVLVGRLDNYEVMINNKPYTCELKLSHQTYGKGIIELDHKDGDHHNNSIGNIQPLCRICHAIKTDLQKDKAGGTGENYDLIKRYELFFGPESTKQTKDNFFEYLIGEKISNIKNAYYDFVENADGIKELIPVYPEILKKYGLYNLPNIRDNEIELDNILAKYKNAQTINDAKLKRMEADDALIIQEAQYVIVDNDPNPKKVVAQNIQQVIMNNNQNDEEKGLIEVTLEGMAELEDLKKNYNVNITDVISIASTKIKKSAAEKIINAADEEKFQQRYDESSIIKEEPIFKHAIIIRDKAKSLTPYYGNIYMDLIDIANSNITNETKIDQIKELVKPDKYIVLDLNEGKYDGRTKKKTGKVDIGDVIENLYQQIKSRNDEQFKFRKN